jgi:hypothetical protein
MLTPNEEARCCTQVSSRQADGLAAAMLLQDTQAMALPQRLGAAKVTCMCTQASTSLGSQ